LSHARQKFIGPRQALKGGGKKSQRDWLIIKIPELNREGRRLAEGGGGQRGGKVTKRNDWNLRLSCESTGANKTQKCNAFGEKRGGEGKRRPENLTGGGGVEVRSQKKMVTTKQEKPRSLLRDRVRCRG